MSAWADIIGNYQLLITPTIKNELARTFYLIVVKEKDHLVDNLNSDKTDEDPFRVYETLTQALTQKKKGESGPTYVGFKKVKDATTSVVTNTKANLPMKKFVTLTIDLKNALTFLLNMYVKQCHACFLKNNNTFKPDDQVAEQVSKYAQQNIDLPIVNAIIQSSIHTDIDKIAEGHHNGIIKKISDKVRTYFKDKEDKVPEKQLTVLIDHFARFMKIMAIRSSDFLFARRQAVNKSFMEGILRQISTDLRMKGFSGIEQEIFDSMNEFIEVNKPPKKEKEENEEEAEVDEADEATEKKEKSKRGRPSTKINGKNGKKSSEKEENEEEGEVAEDDEAIDEAIDELNDEKDPEWSQSAADE